MAVDRFLSIAGLTDEKGAPQPGTVLIDSTPCLRISDFSFGLSEDTGAIGGGGGKPKFEPLSVVLPVDFCTPLLLKACAEETQFTHASVIVQTGAPGPTVTTERYDLKVVVVSSMSVQSSASGDIQSVSFTYGALNITFTPRDSQGKAGTPSTGGWDIVTNTAS